MNTPDDTPDFASRLLDAQATQHKDRQEGTRELIDTVKDMSSHVGLRFDRLEAKLDAKPGKFEVRAIIAISSGVFGVASLVFFVMLLSFLGARGVNTAEVVRDAVTLWESASPEPTPAPATSQANTMPTPTPTATTQTPTASTATVEIGDGPQLTK